MSGFAGESTPVRGSAFGLLIESNEPIPGIAPPVRDGSPDLIISLGAIPPEYLPSPEAPPAFVQPANFGHAEIRASPLPSGGLHFRFVDGCEVATDAELRKLWCRWPEGLEVADVAIYLLGPVMGLVLRRRGLTVLHAAALRRGVAAYALVGPAGSGKSTSAALLAGRGHHLITDDILALRLRTSGEVEVVPGTPRVRLWADAGEALFGRGYALPFLARNWSKRCVDLPEQWWPDPLPLRAVYLVGKREAGQSAPRLETVAAREALVELIGNVYHGWLSHASERAADLDLAGRLVRATRITRLVPRDDAGSLEDMARLIEADLDG